MFITFSFLFTYSPISNAVQSAVTPLSVLEPILGANSRPDVVAANSAISGFFSLITCSKIDEKGSTKYSSSLSFSYKQYMRELEFAGVEVHAAVRNKYFSVSGENHFMEMFGR